MGTFFEILAKSGLKIVYYVSFIGSVIGIISGIITGLLEDFQNALIDRVESWQPLGYQISFTQFQNVLGLVNHFFPLEESWALMVSSLPIIVTILTLKWVKNMIPFLGS